MAVQGAVQAASSPLVPPPLLNSQPPVREEIDETAASGSLLDERGSVSDVSAPVVWNRFKNVASSS